MQNFFGNSELLCKSGTIAASSTAWRASGLVAATLPQPASSCGVEEHTGRGAEEPSPTAAEEPSPTAAARTSPPPLLRRGGTLPHRCGLQGHPSYHHF